MKAIPIFKKLIFRIKNLTFRLEYFQTLNSKCLSQPRRPRDFPLDDSPLSFGIEMMEISKSRG